MDIKLRNFTGEPVTFIREDGSIIMTIEHEPTEIFVKKITFATGDVNGIPMQRIRNDRVIGLPNYVEGTFLIVPERIALSARGRYDLVIASDPAFDVTGTFICAYRSISFIGQ